MVYLYLIKAQEKSMRNDFKKLNYIDVYPWKRVRKGNMFITTELKYIHWSVGVSIDRNCCSFLYRNLSVLCPI